MSEEREQRHARFSVEQDGGGVRVEAKGCAVDWHGNDIWLSLPSLDSAEALRDALSAFLGFHWSRTETQPAQLAVDDDADHAE